MIERILLGGQSGADQGGGRAARAHGIPTGGAMPKGFLSEDSPRPEFAELFGAVELPTSSYPARTERNVRDSDATLWFGSTDTPGARATLEAVRRLVLPSLRVKEGFTTPSHVARWLCEHNVKVLNVAGSRASKAPDLGDRVKRFLGAVLRRLGSRPVD